MTTYVNETVLQHIEGAKKGRQADFMALYNQYEVCVRAYLRSKYYPDQQACDADSVLNDTFEYFFKTLNTFRCECSVETWLLRIAKWRYLSCVKKKCPEPNPADPEQQMASEDSSMCVEECIQQLLNTSYQTAKQRKCIDSLTFKALGMTNQEIAEKMGLVSSGATRVFIHECKKKISGMHVLKHCLKDCSSL